jgi:hypothetical protein
MQLKYSNLGKPVAKRWKTISKFLSRSLPLYIGAVAMAPMPDNYKLWATFILSLCVATISGLSEFTSNEPS